MSQNISMPGARVPLVDKDGVMTREWQTLMLGLFQRVGGAVGFSNSELYGDAVALQSYDELLERISALEAQNRNLAQAVQVLSGYAMEQMLATPPQAVSPDTFARIKVLGETDLAVESGKVRVGHGVGGSNAKLQVGGDLDVSLDVRLRSGLQVDGNAELQGSVDTGPLAVNGDASAHHYMIGGVQVVGARVPGNPAFTAYAGQTMGASYSQTQVQTNDDAVKAVSTAVAALVTAMRTHGLIGD